MALAQGDVLAGVSGFQIAGQREVQHGLLRGRKSGMVMSAHG
jgi:hypothetical protein